MLLTYEVAIEEFVTYACSELVSYADHVTTLRRQSFAGQQAIKNMLPHMVMCDVDFSENMEFTVRNAIQSSYWHGLGGATLFICVARLLCLKAWNDRSSVLKEGDEVTLEVTCWGKAGFHSGFVVEHYLGLDEVKIKLHYDPHMEVPAGIAIYVPRAALHVREYLITPIVAVSNDPHHDRHFVHKFLQHCWYGPSGFIAQLPEEQRRLLSHEIRHSDGAASHFKQRFTMENMYEEFEAADWSKRISWTFGCPRYGKCNCDVFGGIGKNTAERYGQRHDIVIQHAQHLSEILTLLFAADPERTAKHTTRKVKTTDWMIFYLPVEETMPLRGPDCYVDTFTVKLPDPIGLQFVFHIECLGTRQQPHPTQPRVVYRQFDVRRHA
jgi:hypothetical protein